MTNYASYSWLVYLKTHYTDALNIYTLRWVSGKSQLLRYTVSLEVHSSKIGATTDRIAAFYKCWHFLKPISEKPEN